MDYEVAQTLSALEQKLADLERELGSIAGRGEGQGQGPSIIVDEAVEQRYSMAARETIYGEIPATRDSHDSIDLAELVRFRDTMRRTLDGLIEEYSRLLSLRPPSDA